MIRVNVAMKMYHLTYGNRLDSIMEKGLVDVGFRNFYYDDDYGYLKHQPGIYISPNKDGVLWLFDGHYRELLFIDKETYESGRVLLSFDLDPDTLKKDMNTRYESYLVDYIDPSNIIIGETYDMVTTKGDYETMFNFMMDYYVKHAFEVSFDCDDDIDYAYIKDFIKKYYNPNLSESVENQIDVWVDTMLTSLMATDLESVVQSEKNLIM